MIKEELEPQKGVLVTNEKKRNDADPDYVGYMRTPSGELLNVSLWKLKNNFVSLRCRKVIK
jgi:hypothetical protein